MESLAYTYTALAYEERVEATTRLAADNTDRNSGFLQQLLPNGRMYLITLVVIISIFGLASEALAQTLKRGMRGAAVRELQVQLTDAGVYNGPRNSRFGPLTEAAVRRFQRNYNLKADGIVGWRTRERLLEAVRINPFYGNAGGSFNNVAASPLYNNYSTPVLRRGDSGYQVGILQRRLIDLGLYRGQVDEIYGDRTENAIRDFQLSRGLPATGNADAETLRLLSYNVPPNRFYTPPNRFFTPQNPNVFSNRTLRRGDRGLEVSKLQEQLWRNGDYRGEIDGIYGPGTQEAVIRFQRRNNIIPDGIAGPQTLATLYGGNPDAGTPYIVVIPGDNINVVNRVQARGFRAYLDRSRLGNFINAGTFTNREEAENLSALLRQEGLDARVAYSNNFR